MTAAVVSGLVGYALGWIFSELWHTRRYQVADWWWRRQHPRCARSGECLLDDGHKGECDEEPYT